MSPAAPTPASRLLWTDLVGVASLGVRARPGRAALTALGIAVGVAAVVAVVGVSASSRADVLAELDRLGPNLLQASAGQSPFGTTPVLPEGAPAMIRRIGAVESAAATRVVGVTIRRTDLVDEAVTGAISVVATEPDLLATLGAEMRAGRFIDDASARYPTVALGSVAAGRLGIADLDGDPMVWLGDQWFRVVGILEPVPLAPDIDRSALIGYPLETAPSTVRVRTDPDQVEEVRGVLAATANPEAPAEVAVTRPSDALAAKVAVDDALAALLLGVGGVALLVGGIGIANVLVIAVLERRGEIGIRRALGATRRHLAAQFLGEAVLVPRQATFAWSRDVELAFEAAPSTAATSGQQAARGARSTGPTNPGGRECRGKRRLQAGPGAPCPSHSAVPLCDGGVVS